MPWTPGVREFFSFAKGDIKSLVPLNPIISKRYSILVAIHKGVLRFVLGLIFLPFPSVHVLVFKRGD